MRNYGGKCSECGGPMRVDNTYGICNLTPECRRKKGIVKYYRDKDTYRAYSVAYSREHKDKINAKYRARYATQRHEEVTYVAWSPGLKLCKIGITTGLKMRFKALRNACPDIQRVVVFSCGRKLESRLHESFDEECVGGEWFNLGASLVPSLLRIVDEVILFAKDNIN